MGRYGDAIDALKRADPGYPFVHTELIFAYSELGREQDARAEAAEVLRVSPGFSLERLKQMLAQVWWEKKDREFEDLRKAGLK